MTQDEMRHAAEVLAARYSRRCWWADREELAQEAVLAMLSARRTYLKHPEGSEDGYLYRAAAVTLRNVLLRASAPVTAGRSNLDALRGVFRASMQKLEVLPPRGHEGADDRLARERWQLRAEARIGAVLAMTSGGDLARPVLMCLARPAEVADRAGVPVREVYDAARRARAALLSDRVLYELALEAAR